MIFRDFFGSSAFAAIGRNGNPSNWERNLRLAMIFSRLTHSGGSETKITPRLLERQW
jgi:hypothetical protein